MSRMNYYKGEGFAALTDAERQEQLMQKIRDLEHDMEELKVRLDSERSGLMKTSIETERKTRSMGISYIPAQPMRCMETTLLPRRSGQPFTLAPKSLQTQLEKSFPVDNQGKLILCGNMQGSRSNDRPDYMQKLIEIDNLCKEEMARMAACKEELEPLNQIASDWKIQEMAGQEGWENFKAKESSEQPENLEPHEYFKSMIMNRSKK